MKYVKKEAQREEKSQINFAVPVDVKRAFKAVAASRGMTIEEAGVAALKDFLSEMGNPFRIDDRQDDSFLTA